jgi:hypothetical protein
MPVLHQYCITDFQDEVRALVARRTVDRQQTIYELRSHFDDLQWQDIERLLNLHDYLLRDRIVDLVGQESWLND